MTDVLKGAPKVVDTEFVLIVVEHIRQIGTGDGQQRDPERAHGIEDDLYELVLRKVLSGDVDDVQEVIRAALSSKEIQFPRWCA